MSLSDIDGKEPANLLKLMRTDASEEVLTRVFPTRTPAIRPAVSSDMIGVKPFHAAKLERAREEMLYRQISPSAGPC